MQQAKSLYLGELIGADLADYPDSVDLGLLCPLCGKPVFLVKEAVRLRKEKIEYIQPHFSHYRSDSEQGKLCEARVLTKEGRAFLQQLSPESRGQRLALFNKRLWQMIVWKKDIPRDLDRWLARNIPQRFTSDGQIQKMIDHCWKHWRDPEERKQLKEAVPNVVDVLEKNQDVIVIEAAADLGIDIDETFVQETLAIWNMELDSRIQWAICEEVIDYLAQLIAQEVFAKLVKLALFDGMPTAIAEKREFHSNDVMWLVLCSIGLTRWTTALDHFKTPMAGDGFGKS